MERLYVVITKDKDGGYRVSLRDILPATRPMMQSAKLKDPSAARREAERLFGPLQWVTGGAAGCQSFVLQIALAEVHGCEWREN